MFNNRESEVCFSISLFFFFVFCCLSYQLHTKPARTAAVDKNHAKQLRKKQTHVKSFVATCSNIFKATKASLRRTHNVQPAANRGCAHVKRP